MGKTFIRKSELLELLGEDGYRKYIELPMLRAKAATIVPVSEADLNVAEAYLTNPTVDNSAGRKAATQVALKYALENAKGAWAMRRFISTLRDHMTHAEGGIRCAYCDHAPFNSTQGLRMHHTKMVMKKDKDHKGGKMKAREEA